MIGIWEDPDAAYQLYLQEQEDWAAGRNPRKDPKRATAQTATSLGELADIWLDYRDYCASDPTAPSEERISGKSYSASECAIKQMFLHWSRNIDPLRLTREDFKDLRTKLGEGVGPSAKNGRIVQIRAMFNYAVTAGLLPRHPNWGAEFKHVPAKSKRLARFLHQRLHGQRIFPVDLARRILKHACLAITSIPDRFAQVRAQRGGGSKVERAMVTAALNFLGANLVAANTGTQSIDISCLAIEDVDFTVGWINTIRQKTAAPWQTTLWPETLQILKLVWKYRPEPNPAALQAWRMERAKDMEGIPELVAAAMKARPLFLTADGFPLVHQSVKDNPNSLRRDGTPRKKHSSCNAVEQMMRDLLVDLGEKDVGMAKGINFGAWRHTFRTHALPSKLDDVINRVMGHLIEGSDDPYIQMLPNQVRPVTDLVRGQILDAELAGQIMGVSGALADAYRRLDEQAKAKAKADTEPRLSA